MLGGKKGKEKGGRACPTVFGAVLLTKEEGGRAEKEKKKEAGAALENNGSSHRRAWPRSKCLFCKRIGKKEAKKEKKMTTTQRPHHMPPVLKVAMEKKRGRKKNQVSISPSQQHLLLSSPLSLLSHFGWGKKRGGGKCQKDERNGGGRHRWRLFWSPYFLPKCVDGQRGKRGGGGGGEKKTNEGGGKTKKDRPGNYDQQLFILFINTAAH